MIKLSDNANDRTEINELASWLQTYPKLTMGPLTQEFEQKFAAYVGTKHVIMVNSGSSANLLVVSALKLYNPKLTSYAYNYVIVPAISWATTITPYIQNSEFTTILCDTNKYNLGLDLNHLKSLVDKYHPVIIQTANILGFPNDYNEIKEICGQNDVILVEDSCESLGSIYNGIKVGNFGLASTFSFFYGHILSTIEGGAICTNDDKLAIILRMIRAHGWDRNVDKVTQSGYRQTHNISDFIASFAFYFPGYNIRPTEIQAFLGLKQLAKIAKFIESRRRNYNMYNTLLKKVTWKPNVDDHCVNFAYPITVQDRQKVVEALLHNNIECRPIVCGSMNQQPFYKAFPNKIDTLTPQADKIHHDGLYLPNHPGLSEADVELICKTINEVI